MKSTFLITLFYCFFTSFLFSQINNDSTANAKTYVITKSNGKKLTGKILSDDGREILLITEKIGKIYISKSEIIEINEVKSQKTDYLRKNVNPIEDSIFSEKYVLNTSALLFTKKK